MSRRTVTELRSLLANLNKRVEGRFKYDFDQHAGKRRLVREDKGRRAVSPLLPTGALCDWLTAFLDGMDTANEVVEFDMMFRKAGDHTS